MDRRSKIFAPTTSVGGVRRPYKPKQTVSGPSIKSTLDTFRGEMHPTILKTCTYKAGDTLVTFQNPKIQSITTKGKGAKHVCFLVTGDTTSMSEKEALEDMPPELQSIRKGLEGKENVGGDATGEVVKEEEVEVDGENDAE